MDEKTRTSRSSTTRRPISQRRPHQLLRRSSARKASPTSRPSRSTGSPRRCSTPTCWPRCPSSAKGRWLDWKEAAATDPDGRLVGFGTDIGPQALCYRADLFEAAGLPSTPDEVAALFDGDWSNYFDVADQYKAATGKPMIDSAHSVFQGMVNQIEFPYDEPDGTVVATDNPELEDAYNQVVERAIPNAAYAAPVER